MCERIKVAVTPLAHSRIGVKQIIEKPIEARKIYVLRKEKKVPPMVTRIAPLIRHFLLNRQLQQQENRFADVRFF